jgi:hypothetical protein
MKEKGISPLDKNYQFFELRDKFIRNLTQDLFKTVADGLNQFREQAKPYFSDSSEPQLNTPRDISNLVNDELNASPL